MPNLFIPPAQIFDDEGRVLSNGTVWVYGADTSNRSAISSDSNGTASANPVQLSAGGRAPIWAASGSYKARVEDTSNVQLFTQNNLQPILAASSMQLGDDKWFADMGNPDDYYGALNPVPLALEAGLTVCMLARNTNTGPAVLNLNSFGAIEIRAKNQSLKAGDIQAFVTYVLTYDGAFWQLRRTPMFAEGASSTFVVKPNNTTGIVAEVETVLDFNGAGTTVYSVGTAFWSSDISYTNFRVPSGVSKVMMSFSGEGSGSLGAWANTVYTIIKNGVAIATTTPDTYRTDGSDLPSEHSVTWPPFRVSAGDELQISVLQKGSTGSYLTSMASIRSLG